MFFLRKILSSEDDSSIVSLQAELRVTRFPADGSLHLRGLWRRLAFLVDLCFLCADLCSLQFRGDVRRAGGAEKASGESLRLPRPCDDFVTLTGTADSGLVSGRHFEVGNIRVGTGQQWTAEVESLVGWLEIRRCFAAAAAADGVHILDYEVDGIGSAADLL